MARTIPADIPKLLAALDQGADIASGWKQDRRDPYSRRGRLALLQLGNGEGFGRSLARHELRLQGLPRRVRALAYITVRCTASYRCLPLSRAARERGWRQPPSTAPRTVAVRSRALPTGSAGPAHGYIPWPVSEPTAAPIRGGWIASTLAGAAISIYLLIVKLGGEGIGDRPLLFLGILLIVVGIQFLSLGLVGQLLARGRLSEPGFPGYADRKPSRVTGGWFTTRGRQRAIEPRKRHPHGDLLHRWLEQLPQRAASIVVDVLWMIAKRPHILSAEQGFRAGTRARTGPR